MSGVPTVRHCDLRVAEEGRSGKALTPYPAYKDSGVEWLGEVPAHWMVPRLKSAVLNVVDHSTNHTHVSLRIALENVESWTGRLVHLDRDPPAGKMKRFMAGDVLFGKLRPYLAKTVKPNREGVCVGEFLVLRPHRSRVASSYVKHMLRSRPLVLAINSLATGAKMPRVEWNVVGSTGMPLPPLGEQRAIARFLDRQTSSIDRLVEQKRKLVGLLREMRTALVSQAVTKGLDPDVQMKDSGVEWLGEIPAHWDVRRLKTLCSRHAQYGANVPATSYSSSGVRFIRTTDISECGGLKGAGVFLPRELVSDCMLADGDLLISRSGTVGRSYLHEANGAGPCAYAGYLVRFVLRSTDILHKYVFYFTQSGPFADFVRIAAISSTIDNVNGKRYANAPLPLPPKRQQTAIVRFLDRVTSKIDAVIANITEAIDLLNEYRAALISAAVTGQIDVRGHPSAGNAGESPGAISAKARLPTPSVASKLAAERRQDERDEARGLCDGLPHVRPPHAAEGPEPGG